MCDKDCLYTKTIHLAFSFPRMEGITVLETSRNCLNGEILAWYQLVLDVTMDMVLQFNRINPRPVDTGVQLTWPRMYGSECNAVNLKVSPTLHSASYL